MSLRKIRAILAVVAVAAIALATVAAFRTDLTVFGVMWSAYLCMAVGAVRNEIYVENASASLWDGKQWVRGHDKKRPR